jgi:hypothetical protein
MRRESFLSLQRSSLKACQFNSLHRNLSTMPSIKSRRYGESREHDLHLHACPDGQRRTLTHQLTDMTCQTLWPRALSTTLLNVGRRNVQGK